ncbi:unnamed protein product [Urochloa humidicola]
MASTASSRSESFVVTAGEASSRSEPFIATQPARHPCTHVYNIGGGGGGFIVGVSMSISGIKPWLRERSAALLLSVADVMAEPPQLYVASIDAGHPCRRSVRGRRIAVPEHNQMDREV